MANGDDREKWSYYPIRIYSCSIISNQERGTYSNEEPPEIFTEMYTPEADDFLLPYPATDVALNPRLLEEPVPYEFN